MLEGTAIGIRDGLSGRDKLFDGSGMVIFKSSLAFFEGRRVDFPELPEKACKT
jgi:hypothetical protein